MIINFSLLLTTGVFPFFRLAEANVQCTRKWNPHQPDLTMRSCAAAMDQFTRRFPHRSYYFENPPHFSRADTIPLPYSISVNECLMVVNLFYSPRVSATMLSLIAAADHLREQCIGRRAYAGGTITVGDQGLSLDYKPSGHRENSGLVLLNGTVEEEALAAGSSPFADSTIIIKPAQSTVLPENASLAEPGIERVSQQGFVA